MNECLGVCLFGFGCISCCNIPQNGAHTQPAAVQITAPSCKNTPSPSTSALHTVYQTCFFFNLFLSELAPKTLEFIPCMSSSLRVFLPYVHFTGVCTFYVHFLFEILPMPFVFLCENNDQYSMCVCTHCLDSTLCCFCHRKLNHCVCEREKARLCLMLL